MERRTTVKDLLKMKRQQQDPTGPGVSWSEAHSGQTPVNTASIHKYGHFCLWYEPEDPSQSPRPHHSPEHLNSVSPAHPCIAPGTPIPAREDLSPIHALTNPPTPYPNLPGHLHLNPPSIAPSPPAPNSSLPGHLYSAPPVPQQQTAGPAITTLFQWQVQQQLRRMNGVSPEMINMQDSDGDTPLHIAVAQGKRALAYVLAANMALSGTLNLPEHNGQTALHIAAATDQPLMVCDLLENGAHVHWRDAWGALLCTCVWRRATSAACRACSGRSRPRGQTSTWTWSTMTV
uniref:Uncharacterized protein n=1 Tax=Neogobius melanostomus TaxID=47308 RepID=A0A8C6U5A5_9GOBI